MKKIAIIGAGLSGIVIAKTLKPKFNVEIFEKSRGLGGRMSTKRSLPYTFDHGAQYFIISSARFKKFLQPLIKKNVIKSWNCNYKLFKSGQLLQRGYWNITNQHYVGVPQMNSIIKYLSKGLKINLNSKVCLTKRSNQKWVIFDQANKPLGKYDWVIHTAPPRQTYKLINNNISFYRDLKRVEMHGCYSLLVGFKHLVKSSFDAARIIDDDISWIAFNNTKPERKELTSLIINSSYDYALNNLKTQNSTIIKHILKTSERYLRHKLYTPDFSYLHKWAFVEAKVNPKKNFFLDIKERVGACGDWCVNSRVEGAFISAYNLSKSLLKQ